MQAGERQERLLGVLQSSQTPVTGHALAEQLGVSSRTIRNDIQAINSRKAAQIESRSGVGYILTKVPQQPVEPVDQSQDLHFQILKALLRTSRINMIHLANRLYISSSMLETSVQTLNQLLGHAGSRLKIERAENYLLLAGSEGDKRHVFNLFLQHEINKNRLNLAKYSGFFTGIDVAVLLKKIVQLHRVENIQLNDFSTISFVLHIAVLLERVHDRDYYSAAECNFSDQRCLQYAQRLKALLEKEFSTVLPDQELAYVYTLYVGELSQQQRPRDTPTAADDRFQPVINDVLTAINDDFHVDFSRDMKLNGYLQSHVADLYQRAMTSKFLINPMTADIKSGFPFIYNVSVYAAAILQQRLQIHFPDDEIAYLALHFLSSFETIQSQHLKNVLLISPYGVGNRRLVAARLDQVEGFQIKLQSVDHYLGYVAAPDLTTKFDLIITTEEVPNVSNVPVYRYHNFLTDDDLKKISTILNQKRQAPETSVLESYLNPHLFYPQQNLSTPEEVITFLCRQLVKFGYCDDAYTQLVLDREKLSSTAYAANYAIPHAIKRTAIKNGIAVCTLKRAINWHGKNVRLVLLLALTAQRGDDFENLFGELVPILDSKQFVNRLSRTKSVDEFLALCHDKIEQVSVG
ncbi:transcription antiterminator [Lacticaseibacillus paracasei]|uniref:BglG family transcription antiterminator n=1 Tax=Lacticaseibacillus paracasei TaxID=1597 RepID=UPI0018929C4C|nr:BglG family transcription antiterminator [Lacticaseibacillus paracasei]QPC20649.1 transcription antiterminator [Lacticaseibacillus paracasei subsp. tolerans]WCZ19328.1 transcription antiterminator [Lacticaseibacillus paracasei]